MFLGFNELTKALSEDLKVLIECDHSVVDERISVDIRDCKTIRFPYPLSNRQVTVRINGYLIDPLNPLFGYATRDVNGNIVLNVYDDEASVAPKTQKLVFNRPISPDDIVEVSYSSPLAYCRKCFGTSLVFDYEVLSDGTGFRKVTGLSKLRQDCLKAVLTVSESNIFHPWAGTSIESLIGEKYSDVTLIDIKREIGSTLNGLKNLQISQATYQQLSSDEVLLSIDSISLYKSEYDPTIILIEIDITSGSGQQLSISQAFKSTGSISGLLNA